MTHTFVGVSQGHCIITGLPSSLNINNGSGTVQPRLAFISWFYADILVSACPNTACTKRSRDRITVARLVICTMNNGFTCRPCPATNSSQSCARVNVTHLDQLNMANLGARQGLIAVFTVLTVAERNTLSCYTTNSTGCVVGFDHW